MTPEQFDAQIRKRDEEDLRSILKTVYGRRFIWRMLKQCHIGELPWVQDSPDATAFNCGQINIGNILLKDVVRIKPEAYLEMMKQQKEDDDVRKRIYEAVQQQIYNAREL